jgi:hypothetical protein
MSLGSGTVPTLNTANVSAVCCFVQGTGNDPSRWFAKPLRSVA